MDALWFAFRYFSNLPFPGEPGWNEKNAAASLAWLPLVGLALGLCLAALGLFFAGTGFPRSPALKAMLIMALELWIGGARLTEGASKACDALLYGAGRRRSLEIMEESRLGPKGALSLFLMAAAKLCLLGELSARENFTYVLLYYPCWGRWAASFAACRYPAAKEDGMACFFKIGQKPAYLLCGTVFTLLLLLLMPGHFYGAALSSFLVLLFCCRQIQERLGGQTEYTYGLAASAAELSLLFFIAATATLFRYFGV